MIIFVCKPFIASLCIQTHNTRMKKMCYMNCAYFSEETTRFPELPELLWLVNDKHHNNLLYSFLLVILFSRTPNIYLGYMKTMISIFLSLTVMRLCNITSPNPVTLNAKNLS